MEKDYSSFGLDSKDYAQDHIVHEQEEVIATLITAVRYLEATVDQLKKRNSELEFGTKITHFN